MALKSEALLEQLDRAVRLPGPPSSDYDLNPDVVLPAGRRLRDAGVLIPVVETERGPRIYLTKRSSRLKHHPGQVAFPGGKVDDGDADVTAAALREAQEEIALDPGKVQVVGTLPPHETVTSFAVTPVLGLLNAPFDPIPERGEVDEVFTVPLSHVADPTRFAVERRRWQGRWRSYYAIPHGPYYIWGATARILRALADRLAQV